MNKKRGGLGRGLDSLIPQGSPVKTEQTEEVAEPEVPAVGQTEAHPHAVEAVGLQMVPVESITPNPRQPRQVLDEAALEELAYSIERHGVLQPMIVTRVGDVRYALIAGERRWRAARLAGLSEVPVVIKEATSEEMLELALVENLQRADLNPLEEAAAYQSLLEDFGLKQEEVAERVGKSRGAVTNSLRLLRLPERVREALAGGLITEGHARAILQAPSEESQVDLMQLIVDKGLSVRQAEALARRLADAPGGEQTPPAHTELFDEVRALEERFRDALGTRVQLSRSSRGGRLVIYFYSNEELERIYGSIVGEDDQ